VISADCRRSDDAAAVAADDESDGEGDDDDCDDNDSEDGGGDSENDCTMVVDDEDANVAPVVSVVETVAEDGREPRPLLIRAPPPRGLLALLFLPKQVRGPVREVEESEYDWEEDP